MHSYRIVVKTLQAHVHASPCKVSIDGYEEVARRGDNSGALIGGTRRQYRRGGTCTSARPGFDAGLGDEMLL